MGNRSHLQKQASSQSTFTPVTNPFQPRPFAPPTEISPQQQETPDLQAEQEKPKGFGYNLGKISITNRNGVGRLPIQTKLTIGQPGDKYEQEADSVAAQVVNQINAPVAQRSPQGQTIQREEMSDEEELMMKPMVQRQEALGGGTATPDLEASIKQARGSGQPLGEQIRTKMEGAFGANFSGVKIHTDTQSDRLNRSIQARAFTTGSDIFFRQGAYNPGSRGGQELLAHELTHVVQQNPYSIARTSENLPEKQIQPSIVGTGYSFQQREIGLAGFSLPHGSTTHLQRDLMTEKEFRAATDLPGRLYGKRSRGKNLKALDQAVKYYEAQPDVGKPIYLDRLIKQAEEFIERKRQEDKLTDDNPRIAGTKLLIENAKKERKAFEVTLTTIEQAEGDTSGQIENLSSPPTPQEKRKFQEIDGRQYRITGRAPNRIIQEVQRQEKTDENGNLLVEYMAVGEVVDFNNNMPVVRYYKAPINLGDWYPQITQLNGMNVKPTTGIRDAMSLQAEVNKKLDESMKGQGIAIGKDTIDVLYTYSAKLGAGSDLYDCIKGKVLTPREWIDGDDSEVTKKQMQTMLDAVHTKHRVIVSAHSRGTIKTDNAVRLTYRQLLAEYTSDPNVIEESEDEGMNVQEYVAEEVKSDMDRYIKLIYAGNAVQYPSSVLKIKMFVGTKDLVVSGMVGTYTNTGARIASGNKQTTLEKVKGGHSFSNYYQHVSGEAAEDILRLREKAKKKAALTSRLKKISEQPR